jgi:hypothetical protein
MDEVILPEEDREAIIKTADDIMELTLPLAMQNPAYALGAASLALGSMGALLDVPLEDLIKLVSQHYTNQVLRDAAEEAGLPDTVASKAN